MRSFRYSIKSLLLVQAAVLCLFLAAEILGIVELHYPLVSDNQPLVSPVGVILVSDDSLVLEDGRQLNFHLADHQLEKFVRESEFRVDIDEEKDRLAVYVKHRGWLCGTPWQGAITLPLIPDHVPINSRRLIGFAEVVDANGVALAKP